MAHESMAPYPKGSAEYTATYLTTRSLGCSHPVKYHVDDTQEHSKYPSRLGFFHITAKEPMISFLDTRKLCRACLDAVVPDGFHFWSAYSIINGTSATDLRAPEPRWVNMASSSDNYPPLTQAGTEGFPHVSLSLKIIPSHLVSPPVVLSIPKVPGAKEAWEWLQIERKPFYIDQLHLIKGWSLIVERRAKTDSMIAERIGTAYRPEAQQPKAQGRKGNSLDKGTAEVGNSIAASPRAKNKTKVAKDKQSALSGTTESTGSVAEPSVIALDEPDDVSKLLKVDKRKEHTSSTSSTSPKDGKDATKMKSGERSTKKASSATKPDKETEKTKVEITEANGQGEIHQGQIIISGPDSSPGTPGMTAFLRAAEAEESKTPVQSPAFLEKLICGASARGSSTTKTMKIESKRGISSGDKTSRTQPTVDDSLKTTKPSTKESTKPVTKESSTRNHDMDNSNDSDTEGNDDDDNNESSGDDEDDWYHQNDSE
ncbi:hypothetical protein F4824DRAFT_509408 [Ustulina deusta]|nr:hypothetical protein F4824DRAFT_509408 [Ustulina deusta]